MFVSLVSQISRIIIKIDGRRRRQIDRRRLLLAIERTHRLGAANLRLRFVDRKGTRSGSPIRFRRLGELRRFLWARLY
jgi:hypothetical protein